MTSGRTLALTLLAMIAFASNSLLCRGALKETHIDAATFTFVRILSGAVTLCLVVQIQRRITANGIVSASIKNHPLPFRNGTWGSALALFVYAAGFSFAYLVLSAGTGALLLFGAVQATMILWGVHKGESLSMLQIAGFVGAVTGLVVLVSPGVSAPPLVGSILMLGAGVAWGVYSLRGKGEQNPVGVTTGNFIRATPFAIGLSVVFVRSAHFDPAGAIYGIVSGAVTSGLGYVIWYSALPGLKATSAATVQLSVPVLAATGGIMLLDEPITLRYVLASVAVLGGIALVVLTPHPEPNSP